MKMIDKEGRLFGKISVIDVVVLAVVVALAAALYFKSNQTHTGTSVAQVDITYQVLVPGVRSYVAQSIQTEDLLFDLDRSSGGTLGEIIEIETITPGTKLSELQDGTLEDVVVEDAVNLLLTIRGTGLLSEGRYLLNRVYDLGVNSSRNYCTRYAQFTGTVSAILSPEKN